MSEALHVLAGLGVGLLVGFTGVGGGALMTPLLVLAFGVAPTLAVGTDLWFAALTKLVGGAIHGRRGAIDWPIVALLWCGSLPAAALTLAWVRHGGPSTDRTVLTAMGLVLLVTAAAMVAKPWLVKPAAPEAAPAAAMSRGRAAGTVASGALLGSLVTLTSIGAGALGAVLLYALHPRRLSAARLVGTDIVHAVPLTILAGTGYLMLGAVNLPVLGWLLLGSVPGVIVGSLLSNRVPERWLRLAIAVVLTLVGLKLVLR